MAGARRLGRGTPAVRRARRLADAARLPRRRRDPGRGGRAGAPRSGGVALAGGPPPLGRRARGRRRRRGGGRRVVRLQPQREDRGHPPHRHRGARDERGPAAAAGAHQGRQHPADGRRQPAAAGQEADRRRAARGRRVGSRRLPQRHDDGGAHPGRPEGGVHRLGPARLLRPDLRRGGQRARPQQDQRGLLGVRAVRHPAHDREPQRRPARPPGRHRLRRLQRPHHRHRRRRRLHPRDRRRHPAGRHRGSRAGPTSRASCALQYVRTRHGLLEGDFDRIDRQQNFLRAVLRKTLADGTIGNPLQAHRRAVGRSPRTSRSTATGRPRTSAAWPSACAASTPTRCGS